MPLTQLDTIAALVVIDLQKGIVQRLTAQPSAEIVAKSAELARAFRAKGLPVVLVNVTAAAPGRTEAVRSTASFPADWTELVAELEQQPEDILISKQAFGAFLGTKLDERLRERGVTQIFLAGISTSVGVESTGRSAYDLRYNVVFVVDAMTDREEDAHMYSVEKVFPRLGERVAAGDLLRVLRG
jgi:nicotinamidase-related amidase